MAILLFWVYLNTSLFFQSTSIRSTPPLNKGPVSLVSLCDNSNPPPDPQKSVQIEVHTQIKGICMETSTFIGASAQIEVHPRGPKKVRDLWSRVDVYLGGGRLLNFESTPRIFLMHFGKKHPRLFIFPLVFVFIPPFFSTPSSPDLNPAISASLILTPAVVRKRAERQPKTPLTGISSFRSQIWSKLLRPHALCFLCFILMASPHLSTVF